MPAPATKSGRPTVRVCAGKDCRRDQRERFDALVAHLADATAVVTTRCLGVCAGPVVVVDVADETVVLRRIRSRKRREQVLRSALARDLASGLDDRRVTGSKRRKALARARVVARGQHSDRR